MLPRATSFGTDLSFVYASSLDTGKGNDVITGNNGIVNYSTAFNTGDGNDTIIGNSDGIDNYGSMDTGDGNDIITGIGNISGLSGISNTKLTSSIGILDTGDGNDIITGIGYGGNGIYNEGTTNTGNGKDSIISHANLNN